jgi:hypothetical protein
MQRGDAGGDDLLTSGEPVFDQHGVAGDRPIATRRAFTFPAAGLNTQTWKPPSGAVASAVTGTRTPGFSATAMGSMITRTLAVMPGRMLAGMSFGSAKRAV